MVNAITLRELTIMALEYAAYPPDTLMTMDASLTRRLGRPRIASNRETVLSTGEFVGLCLTSLREAASQTHA